MDLNDALGQPVASRTGTGSMAGICLILKIVVVGLCFVGISPSLWAKEMSVRWTEIPPSVIVGHKVEVRLASDAVLKGRAIATTAEGLRLEITKARNAVNYQVGESLIPVAEIISVKVTGKRIRGRIIFTALFGGISVLGGVGAAIEAGSSFTPGAVVLMAGLPVAGYALGWLLDRRTLTIHVLP